MTFFDQIIQRVFYNSNEKSVNIRETLKRNDKFRKEYSNWRESAKFSLLMEKVKESYYYKKANIASSNNILLFSGRGSEGFALSYEKGFGKKSLQYLLEFFKENILKLTYTVHLAEFQMNEKSTFVESKEKYYLKPNFRQQIRDKEICNQIYGNVLLEYVLADNKPSYLKVLVTHYQDSLFTKVLDFDELVEKMFKDI